MDNYRWVVDHRDDFENDRNDIDNLGHDICSGRLL